MLERRLGVLDDRHVVAADVAREAPGAALAVAALGADLERGGAQQMTGAAQPHPDAGQDLVLLVEGQALQQLDRRAGVLGGVERLGIGVAAVALLAGVARLLLLDLAGVLEDQRDQPAARLGAVDRTVEALGDEAGQETGVVEVSVRQQDRRQLVRLEDELAPVALLELVVALVETAVDQQPGVAPAQQGGAAGDRSARAAECDFAHGSSSVSLRV